MLTLADEVRFYSPYIFCPSLRPRYLEDQVCLVWKKDVEYATSNLSMISSDRRAAFWLFIVVRLVYVSVPFTLLTVACRIGTFRWATSFGYYRVSLWPTTLALGAY